MKKWEKIIQVILVILLLIVANGQTAQSEERDQLDEKEKLFLIAQTLEFRKRPYINQDEGFCRSFLESLKGREGIEFIEPIVKTDDYNDPELQSYLGKCPKLQLNKSVAYEPRIWEYAKTLPEEEREKLGTVSYTTTDFRLYHIDVDNNPKNGKEYLFYGGGRFSPQKKWPATFTDYLVVDFDKCEIKGRGQVRETINYFTKKPTGNHNFIIRFREKTCIIELSYWPNEKKHYISLYKFKFFKEIKKFSSFPICYYDPIEPGKGGDQK